jgi:hypothetical protein
MLKITFRLDQENDGIAVDHDDREVFWDDAPDGWTSYFQTMPTGVPVLLDYDNGDPREDDHREYPQGEDTDGRLKRWLADNRQDPRIEDGDDVAGEEMTVHSKDLYFLLLQVAERFYWHGVEDVQARGTS